MASFKGKIWVSIGGEEKVCIDISRSNRIVFINELTQFILRSPLYNEPIKKYPLHRLLVTGKNERDLRSDEKLVAVFSELGENEAIAISVRPQSNAQAIGKQHFRLPIKRVSFHYLG